MRVVGGLRWRRRRRIVMRRGGGMCVRVVMVLRRWCRGGRGVPMVVGSGRRTWPRRGVVRVLHGRGRMARHRALHGRRAMGGRPQRRVDRSPSYLPICWTRLFHSSVLSASTLHSAAVQTIPSAYAAGAACTSCRLPSLALSLPLPLTVVLSLALPFPLVMIFLLTILIVIVQRDGNRTEGAMSDRNGTDGHGDRCIERCDGPLSYSDVLADANFDALIRKRA